MQKPLTGRQTHRIRQIAQLLCGRFLEFASSVCECFTPEKMPEDHAERRKPRNALLNYYADPGWGKHSSKAHATGLSASLLSGASTRQVTRRVRPHAGVLESARSNTPPLRGVRVLGLQLVSM